MPLKLPRDKIKTSNRGSKGRMSHKVMEKTLSSRIEYNKSSRPKKCIDIGTNSIGHKQV